MPQSAEGRAVQIIWQQSSVECAVMFLKALSFVSLVTVLFFEFGMEKKVEQRTVLNFLCKSGSTPIQCWR